MTALTPLGQRTRDGFVKKYGKDGEAKFRSAMDNGTIDRGKMENVLIAEDPGKKTTAGARGAPEHDTVTSMEGTAKPKGAVGRAAPGTFQARPG